MLAHRNGGLLLPEARGSPLHKTRSQSCVQPACLLGLCGWFITSLGSTKEGSPLRWRRFRCELRALSSHFLLSTEFSSAASLCPVTLLRQSPGESNRSSCPRPHCPQLPPHHPLPVRPHPRPHTFPQSQRALLPFYSRHLRSRELFKISII